MEKLHVITTALLLMTGAAVGVLAQNDTDAPDSDRANETGPPEPVANDSEANETAQEDEEDEEADKITICHVPPGNPSARHTIEVGEPAWQAHEGHGDHKGACGQDAESEDASSDDETETNETDDDTSENETQTNETDENETEANESSENQTDTNESDTNDTNESEP